MDENKKDFKEGLTDRWSSYKKKKSDYRDRPRSPVDLAQILDQVEDFFNRDKYMAFITNYILEIYFLALVLILFFKPRYERWPYYLRYMISYMGPVNISSIVILLAKKDYEKALFIEIAYLISTGLVFLWYVFWYRRLGYVFIVNGMIGFIIYRLIRITSKLAEEKKDLS